MTARQDDQFQQVLARVEPQAKLLRWWPMVGGSSAETTAFKFQLPNQPPQTWLVRQLKTHTVRRNPNAAVEQFKVQQQLYTAGLAVPKPITYDQSNAILPTPYVIFEFIDGEPIYSADITLTQVGQIAKQLAHLHQFKHADTLNTILPSGSTPNLSMPHLDLQQLIAGLDWQTVLINTMNHRTLLHGDFWPGNLLWRNGQLAAVIDWEDAKIGNPLEDLAISRFDVCFIFGRNALDHFTQTYLTHNPISIDTLPIWDLHAANRVLNGLPDWADEWPAMGRPELIQPFIHSEALWFASAAMQKASKY